MDSLTRRKSSTSADTTRYDLDSPRHTDLIAALELADEVKTALQNDVDAALGAVFCRPKFPWVIAAPFLDVYDYDGGCILLHCHEVRRGDIYPDSIGGVAVNQTAKDDAWRAVEWMLHVMAAGGRFRDTEASLRVTVYLGLFSEAGQLVLTDEKTWGAGDVFGDAIQLEVAANFYKVMVLRQMVDKVDYGHCHYDHGQLPGEIKQGTEVYDVKLHRTGVVKFVIDDVNCFVDWKEETSVAADDETGENKKESGRNLARSKTYLRPVAIVSDVHGRLPTPTPGHLAVVARGTLTQRYGRVVMVDSIGCDKCWVHYNAGEETVKFKLDAKNLAAHDTQAVEDAQPRRWAVAMFVPHDIILKAVSRGIDVGPGLTDVMKEHFLAERSTSTMTKHSYPKRSVLKRAEETQSQPDSIPTEADEYGCDDPYAWVAEHKSSERWTWECDRAVRRTASQAQQGKQVTTKKVGCPVRYHLWLVNGRWVAGQTCNHMGQRSIAREVDRLAALRRDNLVHGIERLNVEHATYGVNGDLFCSATRPRACRLVTEVASYRWPPTIGGFRRYLYASPDVSLAPRPGHCVPSGRSPGTRGRVQSPMQRDQRRQRAR